MKNRCYKIIVFFTTTLYQQSHTSTGPAPRTILGQTCYNTSQYKNAHIQPAGRITRETKPTKTLLAAASFNHNTSSESENFSNQAKPIPEIQERFLQAIVARSKKKYDEVCRTSTVQSLQDYTAIQKSLTELKQAQLDLLQLQLLQEPPVCIKVMPR